MSQTTQARKPGRLANEYRLAQAALDKFHASGPPAPREPKAPIAAAVKSPGPKSSKLANEFGPAELRAWLADESPISKPKVPPPKQPTFSPEVADKPTVPKPAGEIKPWDPFAYKQKPKAAAAVVAVNRAGDGGDGGPEHESGDHARAAGSATEETEKETKLDGDWELVAAVDDEEDWEVL